MYVYLVKVSSGQFVSEYNDKGDVVDASTAIGTMRALPRLEARASIATFERKEKKKDEKT